MDGLSESYIAGKKLFLVQGDKPQLMDWEKYGLRISVPEGSLSSSETTEIAVIALVGGHFKYVLFINFIFYPSLLSSLRFPKNTRLVSAVYAISASHLLKALKLEVQHCIDLRDPSLCKYLKFVVAPVHTSSLPYQFSIVEGGEFPANSRYGSIERSKFCLLGAVAEETGGQGNGEQEQNNEGQGQSNGEGGGGDSGDGESGDEGGKEGEKKKESQRQQGEEGGGAGPHEKGAGPHSGEESGGIEGNKQQNESLQQEGADKELEQYQDGEDEKDEVKSKAEEKKVQHRGKCMLYF